MELTMTEQPKLPKCPLCCDTMETGYDGNKRWMRCFNPACTFDTGGMSFAETHTICRLVEAGRKAYALDVALGLPNKENAALRTAAKEVVEEYDDNYDASLEPGSYWQGGSHVTLEVIDKLRKALG